MNRRTLRLRILRWLLKLTSPFYPEVQIVRVRARPDFSEDVSRWTADEFGDPKGACDGFLIVVPGTRRGQ